MKIRLGIICKGRDGDGNEVLVEGVPVTILIRSKEPPIMRGIEIEVQPLECPHNTGGHGQRCKASHPEQDKVGDGVFCPFSLDYPYLLENNPNWKPPEIIAEAFFTVKKESGY